MAKVPEHSLYHSVTDDGFRHFDLRFLDEFNHIRFDERVVYEDLDSVLLWILPALPLLHEGEVVVGPSICISHLIWLLSKYRSARTQQGRHDISETKGTQYITVNLIHAIQVSAEPGVRVELHKIGRIGLEAMRFAADSCNASAGDHEPPLI
ncbi:MAG: hypothetical protein ABSD02_24715 [Steroidobacteraceae bacterium]